MTVESEWCYFKNKEDWDHYCAKVDDRGRPFRSPWDKDKREPPYNYFHDPEPDSFPCLGKVEFEDDPNGPYCMFYQYVYLTDAAWLLNASLDDLVKERDGYRNLAIDMAILLGEIPVDDAARFVDSKVKNG